MRQCNLTRLQERIALVHQLAKQVILQFVVHFAVLRSSRKFCRISAALRHALNSDSDFVGFLVIRNGHHGRDASLCSIDIQFPKVEVADGNSTLSDYAVLRPSELLRLCRVIADGLATAVGARRKPGGLYGHTNCSIVRKQWLNK